MNLRQRLGRAGRLAAAALLAFSPPPPGRSGEPPAPALAEQLARARADGDAPAVAELCRRQLAQSPQPVPALLWERFHAQFKAGDHAAAAETLDRLAQVNAPAAELAEARGDLALAVGKPLNEPLAAWREALAANPADAPALLGKIADALDKDGEWTEAAEALRAFLKVRPGHAARTARLAVCLLNSGQPEEADKEMLAAVRADAADNTVKAAAPLFDRLRPLLPTLRDLRRSFPAAPFRDLRAGANTPEAARLDRALLFYRVGAYDAALTDAGVVSELAELAEGRSVAADLLRGQCLWQLNREKEAVALRVAKIADKKWFDDAKRCDRLRAADDFAAPPAPVASARAHAARALVLLEGDQPVLALEDAEYAVRAEAAAGVRSADTPVVLAAALLRCDRPAEAFAEARRAAELDPRNADAWAMRGRLEQEGADFPAAVEDLSRALALREEPRWLRRRENCLRSLGRTAEAERDAQRLARLPASS